VRMPLIDLNFSSTARETRYLLSFSFADNLETSHSPTEGKQNVKLVLFLNRNEASHPTAH
jgi:hypothetical protein